MRGRLGFRCLSHRQSWWSVMVALGIPLLGLGCAAALPGSELVSRPEPTLLPAVAGASLTLPGTITYSIRSYESSETAEYGGTADATAGLNPPSGARASARVEQGGTARATFQLGHVFRNDSAQQVELRAKIRLSAVCSASNTPPSALPDALATLTLFARDGRNRLITSEPLLQRSSEQGNGQLTVDKQFDLTLTLAPGEAASLYVAGAARVDARSPRNASAAIEMRDLTMELQVTPAPAVAAPLPAGG